MNIITLDPRTSRRQWHRCVVHAEPTAEFCERNLKKGALVYCEGSLEIRKWLREGGESETWTCEVAVHKVVALDWQRGNDKVFEDEPDAEAPPPTPEAGKIDNTLSFLAPDDHQRAERRAAGELDRRPTR